MARQRSPKWRSSRAVPPLDPATRHRLIHEAAHALYERGGFVHGHDMDDWLAAEAYIDSHADRLAAPLETSPGAPGTLHGRLGAARDEALKRIVRQHPRRDIPRVEDVEPLDAPPKE